jgi:3',5'-nucleoside bisphosphate phosphatase
MDNIANKIPVDLHCHSTYSDGAHGVKEVLTFVKANNGKNIALTDHDTVSGLKEAKIYAKELELNLIGGVEISVTWDKNTLIHILGLGINENNPELIANLQNLRSFRYLRGEKIAQQLEKAGIPNALAGALKYCQEKESLSRTHFARFLVENGYAKSNRVFEKYLTNGRVGYVPQIWATLADAVSWITNSGGIAVIAHPARYKLTRTKLIRLITEFKECGGEAIEVISSSHSEEECMNIARISKEYNLLASMGTDFHNIDTYPKVNVGLNYPLPSICSPIYPRLGVKL